MAYWVKASCSLISQYRPLGGTCCFLLHVRIEKDEGEVNLCSKIASGGHSGYRRCSNNWAHFYAPYGASLFRKRFAFRDDLCVKVQRSKFSRQSDPPPTCTKRSNSDLSGEGGTCRYGVVERCLRYNRYYNEALCR
jgi:hypothetical protein